MVHVKSSQLHGLGNAGQGQPWSWYESLPSRTLKAGKTSCWEHFGEGDP